MLIKYVYIGNINHTKNAKNMHNSTEYTFLP